MSVVQHAAREIVAQRVVYRESKEMAAKGCGVDGCTEGHVAGKNDASSSPSHMATDPTTQN
jgi:hypothetical protein